jgi:hypothetical protein
LSVSSSGILAVFWLAAPALQVFCAKKRSLADNFLQKQQKQRGYRKIGGSGLVSVETGLT